MWRRGPGTLSAHSFGSTDADTRRIIGIMYRSLEPLIAIVTLGLALSSPAFADSSGPRLAAYYNSYMAICGDQAYTWDDDELPRAVLPGVRQVGVGKRNSYALMEDGTLVGWNGVGDKPVQILTDAAAFHAGRSGLLVIRSDGNLLHFPAQSFLGLGEKLDSEGRYVASDVRDAAVGDSANYYVTIDGRLNVTGLAHRGQYGDGRLEESKTFVETARDVLQVSAHTGHALILKNDGSVWGTGGNIYGPLGRHGLGDKAIRWGRIFNGAVAIATGSTHTLAIDAKANLWVWGRNDGLEPKHVLSDVIAAAGSSDSSLAMARGSLWQWDTGEKPRRLMDCP